MIRLAVVFTAFAAAAAVAVADEPPTRSGDIIGSVVMRSDRSLSMRLRSVQCDGTLAEGILDIKPPRETTNWLSTMSAGCNPTKQSRFPHGPRHLAHQTRTLPSKQG
jgi:hypothetical protein